MPILFDRRAERIDDVGDQAAAVAVNGGLIKDVADLGRPGDGVGHRIGENEIVGVKEGGVGDQVEVGPRIFQLARVGLFLIGLERAAAFLRVEQS